jgi:hypothetical protein
MIYNTSLLHLAGDAGQIKNLFAVTAKTTLVEITAANA